MERNERLKKKLIARIKDIDDGEILNQIGVLVYFDEKFDEVYVLSPEERAAVEEGIRQIKNGQWISNEEANRQTGEWLAQQKSEDGL